jgi:hypothetical protein
MLKEKTVKINVFNTDNIKSGDTITFISKVSCADFEDNKATIEYIDENSLLAKTMYGFFEINIEDVEDGSYEIKINK